MANPHFPSFELHQNGPSQLSDVCTQSCLILPSIKLQRKVYQEKCPLLSVAVRCLRGADILSRV